MSFVLNEIYSNKWAITQAGLNKIISIASREGSAEALKLAIQQKQPAQALRSHILARKENGIYHKGDTAVISVNGPIIPYANFFTETSGCVSIETIKNQITLALSDSSIKRILFDIDSSGGNVVEVHSLVQIIFEARSQKRIEAYIGGYGCSAAYWIASACHKIYIDKTAEAGSVGVVLGFIDTTIKDEKEGVKRKEFTNTDSPKKRMKKDSPEFEKEMITIADDIAEVFIESVAKNRNVSVETVKDKYGQGWVFVGKKAVNNGLCDELATFEDLFKTQTKTNQEKPVKMEEDLKNANATIATQNLKIADLETKIGTLQNELKKTSENNRKDKYASLINNKINEATAKGHSAESAELKQFKSAFEGKFEKFAALDDETIATTINAINFSNEKVNVEETSLNLNQQTKSTSTESANANNV